MGKNKRKHPRKEIKVSVELTFLEEPYTIVSTRDISEGGMFIEVKPAEKFPIGELVNVHYLDPLNNDEDKFLFLRDAFQSGLNHDAPPWPPVVMCIISSLLISL